MSNIVLRNLEKTPAVQEIERKGYLYKDLAFDLNPSFTFSGELFKEDDQVDLQPLYDQKAVVKSLNNILTTSPGEKLLNPTFGIDLRDYLFDPVSETRAFFIGNHIYTNLPFQEPRITITQLEVIAAIDDQQYDITISIDIPSLNVAGVSLRGVLNTDGYTFVN